MVCHLKIIRCPRGSTSSRRSRASLAVAELSAAQEERRDQQADARRKGRNSGRRYRIRLGWRRHWRSNPVIPNVRSSVSRSSTCILSQTGPVEHHRPWRRGTPDPFGEHHQRAQPQLTFPARIWPAFEDQRRRSNTCHKRSRMSQRPNWRPNLRLTACGAGSQACHPARAGSVASGWSYR